MHDIQRYAQIDSKKLVRGEYFESLLSEASENNVLSSDEIKNIQLGLLTLLSKQIDRYTSKESSSVRIENAQSILQSISYTIGMALKAAGDADNAIYLLKTGNIEDIYSKGVEVIKSYLEKTKLLSDQLRADDFTVNNYAYYDTVHKGIPVFFSCYDWRFSANDSAGSIDYPLSFDKMDISGVEYIYEYLYHLSLENKICSKFPLSDIECLMKNHSKHYNEDLINVYELVLSNLLGRSLLGYSPEELAITDADRNTLEIQLGQLNSNEIDAKLYSAFDNVMSDMNINDDSDKDYLKKILPDIVFRIKHNLSMKKLEKVFISLYSDEDIVEEINADGFVDGDQMEDEKLRQLIDEISACRHLSEKISMVKLHVKSLSDLMEVLGACFFEGEFIEVFKLLDINELGVIKRLLEEEKMQNYITDNCNDEDSWKEAFLEYTKVIFA